MSILSAVRKGLIYTIFAFLFVTSVAVGALVPNKGHAAELNYVYTADSNTMIIFVPKGETHEGVCARVSETPYDPDLVETVPLGGLRTFTIC